jgi:spermidine synthase
MTDKNKRTYIFSLFILGAASLFSQILLMREILTSFGGNELVIGSFFGFWMLLTAFGSFLGRMKLIKSGLRFFLLHIVLILILTGTLYLIPVIVSMMANTGEIFAFQHMLLISAAIIFFPCIILGFLFPYYTSELKANTAGIGSAYGIEAIGSLAGGIIFTVLLLFFADTFYAWLLLMTLLSISGMLHSGPKPVLPILLSVAILAGFIILWELESPVERSTRIAFPGSEVMAKIESPLGRTTVIEEKGQITVIKDNNPVFSFGNIISAEEPVHLGMSFANSTEKILAIYGGTPEIIREIIKYNPKKLDHLDIDPYSHELIISFMEKGKTEISDITPRNPISFLRNNEIQYDVILVLVPDPSTASLNRYYTREFYKLLSDNLDPKGVLLCSLSSEGNYLGEYTRASHSSLSQTIRDVFEYQMIIPLEQNYFIASHRSLKLDLFSTLENSTISTLYFNETYIDEKLIEFRQESLLGVLDINGRVNSFDLPINYYLQMKEWLSLFNINIYYLMVPVVLIFLLIFLILKPVSLGIFTAGFSVSSLQFLFIISFQVIYGYVYLLTAIFIAIFMAGLATGGITFHRIPNSGKKMFFMLALGAIGLVSILFPYIFHLFSNLSQIGTGFVFIFYIFISFSSGLLMGYVFSSGSAMIPASVRQVSSITYSVDLIGSAFGSVLVSLLLFPLAGLKNTSHLIALIVLVATISILIRKKKW